MLDSAFDPKNLSAKVGRILRVDKDEVLAPTCANLAKATGREGVLERIGEEIGSKMLEKLDFLGVAPGAMAEEIYDALISKIEADDMALFGLLHKPNYLEPSAYKTILGFAREFSQVGDGFFLKTEKARELLRREPPRHVLQSLGYSNIDMLLEKEDLLEVFSALRFLEEREWLNDVFFKQYESLTPADFERRHIEIRVMSQKWREAAEVFLQKKHHNVSHLKELGVIFVIPWSLGVAGETLRLLAMLLHYMHEVEFYSKIFERLSRSPESFAEHFISALRGDIPKERPADVDTWLIVQRYLAKEDEFDWRLFWPHVNPEAFHWQRAAEDIVRIASHFQIPGLSFWHDMGWVGDYFKTETGIDVLVSFDLVDIVMSLVKRQQLHKYLYHQQEALWNKIFSSYVGEDTMRNLTVEHFAKHQMKVSKLGLMLEQMKRV